MKTVIQKSVLAFSFLYVVSYTFAQAGILDSSFGVNGKAANVVSQPAAIAVQKDGKIIVAGTYGEILNGQSNFIVARYTSVGLIDSSFGINGKVNTYFDTGVYRGSVATTIVIQPDDKILVGGWLYHPTAGPDEFAVARYLPNGNLDSSFGINGKTHNPTDFFRRESYLYTLALSSGGEIFAGGFSDGNCVTKYKPNGVIDSSFGINGVLRKDDYTSGIIDLQFQKSGKIITGSFQWDDNFTTTDFRINSLFSSGYFDSSFGDNGTVITDFNGSADYLYSLAVLKNGETIVTGNAQANSTSKVAIAKYRTNGLLDSSFGINGKFVSAFSQASATSNKILVQQDGKFIVSGSILGRINANGTIDSSYGTNGTAQNFDGAIAAAIQQDEKVITINGSYIKRYKSDLVEVNLQKNISVTEGNTGTTTPATFTITLNKAATKQVKVNYHTRNLSAKSGSDYFAKSTTLAFAPGVTSKTITVNVKGDNTIENNERFALVITDPINAVLGKDSVICIIKNDDPSFTSATTEDALKISSITIYPNPVKDILTIDGLKNIKTTITIINEEGKVVAVNTTPSNVFTQNVKQLPAGTYFVKIESDNETRTLKFIKQ